MALIPILASKCTRPCPPYGLFLVSAPSFTKQPDCTARLLCALRVRPPASSNLLLPSRRLASRHWICCSGGDPGVAVLRPCFCAGIRRGTLRVSVLRASIRANVRTTSVPHPRRVRAEGHYLEHIIRQGFCASVSRAGAMESAFRVRIRAYPERALQWLHGAARRHRARSGVRSRRHSRPITRF